jgi:phosphoribosylformimino-5-aminoimidazole carboxamide ribotide isomerase
MILYPAIDILDGKAVRLTKGDFDARKIYDEDPLSAARGWVQEGARWLHVVDLDGARRGEPVNVEQLRRIVEELDVPVQFGGGLRSSEAITAAFDAGASRVILGTAAFTEPELPFRAIQTYGVDRVLVSIDAREGHVATHGWVEATEVPVGEAIERLNRDGGGVKHFVFTNIDHDGMLDGPNGQEAAMAARAAGQGSVIISGGIGELEHLRALVRLREEQRLHSLQGVIVGKALYERRFTVAEGNAVLEDAADGGQGEPTA